MFRTALPYTALNIHGLRRAVRAVRQSDCLGHERRDTPAIIHGLPREDSDYGPSTIREDLFELTTCAHVRGYLSKRACGDIGKVRAIAIETYVYRCADWTSTLHAQIRSHIALFQAGHFL